ncbi:MAG: rod shape-determining protein MreC [Ruminococcaceae bacterium]|nr:rod shape-determining protein MreC [Oscillospiraceae bacterium]
MRDLIMSKSFKKLICVLLCLITAMTVSALSGKSVVSNFLSRATLGMQEVSAEASDNFSSKSYDELLEENKKLSSEVASLRTQLVDYYDVKLENARLWKYYDLKRDYPEYELLPATVVRRDPAADFYGFTINKGYSDGISTGDPVVTENGLIGWISGVDSATARVKTILSPDAKVSVLDSASRDTGVVTGSVKLCDQNLTTMTKISAQNTMKAGDIIVTTGVSGIYPPSVIVGEVKEIQFDEYDTSKYAVIKPFEDITSVVDVVVITDFDGKGELSKDSIEEVAPTISITTAPIDNTAPSTEFAGE